MPLVPLMVPTAASVWVQRTNRQPGREGFLTRRGQFYEPPFAAGAAPPPPPPYPPGYVRQARRRGALVRRGEFFVVPSIAITPPAAPAFPPGFIRQAVRRPLFLRRTSHLEPPWQQPTRPPAPVAARRRTGSLARKGEYWAVPPAAPVVGGPGPLIQPPYRQAIRRGMLCRRGQFYKIPLVGGAPLTPTAWPPPIITARRHRTYPTRRRAPFTVPNATPPPCSYIGARRLSTKPTRRGHYFQPPWPQVITASPTYPPQRIAARRRPIPRPRGMHCRFFEPGWPQAISTITVVTAYVEVIGDSSAGTIGAGSTSGSMEASSQGGTVGAASVGGSVEAGTVPVEQPS
jgi:hypothetical protein